MNIVKNFWGWTPKGIYRWMTFGWAWPFATWGVEVTGSSPRRFTRRCKIGPVCFAWGDFPDGAKAIPEHWWRATQHPPPAPRSRSDDRY